MKKQEKIFEVENLAAKIKQAKSLALVDYRGLSANQIANLRSLVKKAGGELQVVKNTLLLRALDKASLEIKDLKIEGPTLALFANEDEINPLKTLVSFGKAQNLLALKFGFFGGEFQDGTRLFQIASLPSKEELQAKLVGLLAQPSQKLVYVLNFNLQKLVVILKGGDNRV